MNKENSFSVFDSKGKILFFGLSDFIDKIANGSCCFICGATPDQKEFNDEHVIPDWILRKYNLYPRFITLPNGTTFRYGQYTVPCCKECNTELGEFYEKPISNLLCQGYRQICKSLDKNPELYYLIFKWLCLIYLKTHLKDKTLKWDRDHRKESFPISDVLYWEEMHHIHCIARSYYTGAEIDGKVYGTFFILPSINGDGIDNFDYGDNLWGKGVLMQLDEFSIVAVLNDSGAGLSLWSDQFSKINGPVTHFQLREIFSIMNYININLKIRPVYQSLFSPNCKYKITVDLPEFAELVDKKDEAFSVGKILSHYVEPMIKTKNKAKILHEIEEGKRGYLFDKDGSFVNYTKKV
ncbi:MAG: HNH endonuclease [Bacteroidales bacterium]|jgi:hypothetical protein|nr:HNH endonuclease [Bacteroidales bacterium]